MFHFQPNTQFPFPETNNCQQSPGYPFPQSTPHPAPRRMLWKCDAEYSTPLPILLRMSLYLLTWPQGPTDLGPADCPDLIPMTLPSLSPLAVTLTSLTSSDTLWPHLRDCCPLPESP